MTISVLNWAVLYTIRRKQGKTWNEKKRGDWRDARGRKEEISGITYGVLGVLCYRFGAKSQRHRVAEKWRKIDIIYDKLYHYMQGKKKVERQIPMIYQKLLIISYRRILFRRFVSLLSRSIHSMERTRMNKGDHENSIWNNNYVDYWERRIAYLVEGMALAEPSWPRAVQST